MNTKIQAVSITVSLEETLVTAQELSLILAENCKSEEQIVERKDKYRMLSKLLEQLNKAYEKQEIINHPSSFVLKPR